MYHCLDIVLIPHNGIHKSFVEFIKGYVGNAIFVTEHIKNRLRSVSSVFSLCFTDQCTVTRSYLFLHKFWFFSAIYYFGNWAFIAVSHLSSEF